MLLEIALNPSRNQFKPSNDTRSDFPRALLMTGRMINDLQQSFPI
jgi:hypothetical protein